jgi:putative ABC transport system substrate-binding protein
LAVLSTAGSSRYDAASLGWGGMQRRGFIGQGTSSSELPVVQPTKFELVINLRTLKTLGLTASPSLRAPAHEVIE